MTKISGKIKGNILFTKIEFDYVFQRYVSRSNNTSGKINIPVDFIGREVFVAIPTDKTAKRKKK